MKLVSACLAGIKCRWDGEARPCQKVIELVKQGKAIPICPEQLGGLTTPRTPAEQKGNKVFTKDGKDVTSQFEKGAEETLKIALLINCKEAILKSKSPSCGCGETYDGTFSGALIKGDGVTTTLLKKHGINVITERELEMKHKMRLHPNPFDRIKSGKKKVEIRLNDPKRQKLREVDQITFNKRPDFKETLQVKITKLRNFKTYADLINNYSLKDLDLTDKTKEQIIKEGAVYYPEDKIKKYGFLAIEIKLI